MNVNSDTERTFHITFDGATQVGTPLDHPIGTRVAFSGVGRVSGTTAREPFLDRGERVFTHVTIEKVSGIGPFGAAEAALLSSLNADEDGDQAAPTKPGFVRTFFRVGFWVSLGWLGASLLPLILR